MATPHAVALRERVRALADDASRRGQMRGPVDDALEALGLKRRVVVVVPSFPAALAIATTSDLVGLVTESFVRTGHADPAHRWMREVLVSVGRPHQAMSDDRWSSVV